MRIICVGISHKTAGVETRERVAFDPVGVERGLADLDARWPQAEAAILSTCNRTEVYIARAVHGYPREHELRQWLGDFHDTDATSLDNSLYTLTDAEAVRHLLEVTAGLDSLVVGESQITGQVREAYAIAVRAGTARSIMNLLFQSALGCAKHVRGHTQFGSSCRSVASLAIDVAAESLGDLTGTCVLSVGAGKMNHLMIRRLGDLGVASVTITNRSGERARQLAEQCGGQAIDWSCLPQWLSRADILVTSTASDWPVITRSMLAEAIPSRNGRPLVLVDIAVPRDIEPEAASLPGVKLFDIDTLERLLSAKAAPDATQQAAAEKIIRQQADSALKRLSIRQVAPTIGAMYQYMRRIADEELDTAIEKLATHDDTEEDQRIIRRALRRTIRRILHPAVTNLRRDSADNASAAHIAALRQLFGLDDGEEDIK